MKKSYLVLLVSIFLSVVNGCKKAPTEVSTSDNNNYMSLHVGDVRQLYTPYSSMDTIYMLWKVTGKTFRSDDLEVYKSEWYTYNLNPQNSYYQYNFIRDGYYYGTQLDSTSTYPGNPYFEQKLAEINPKEGDTLLQIVGLYDPDSTQKYIYAKYLGSFKTPAGIFNNVFCFVNYESSANHYREVSETFYTKQFGYLGITTVKDSLKNLLVVNYMDINGNKIGNYVDMSKRPGKRF